MNSILFFIALGFYLASTAFYLVYLAIPSRKFERIGNVFLCGGFILHCASLLWRYIEAGHTPITNMHEALSFFSCSLAGFFLFIKRKRNIEILGTLVLPVISLMLIWASVMPRSINPIPPVLQSFWLPVHTILCFLGNAIFLMSFLISIVYLVVEGRIKKKSLPSITGKLPSLETLDSLNERCMSYGFPFLTAGIITGSLWAGFAWGSYWSWDPKEVFSLTTWIVYAILLHNRLAIGWRGRRTAYLMIVGFVMIVFTFLGVTFLTGGRHSYL